MNNWISRSVRENSLSETCWNSCSIRRLSCRSCERATQAVAPSPSASTSADSATCPRAVRMAFGGPAVPSVSGFPDICIRSGAYTPASFPRDTKNGRRKTLLPLRILPCHSLQTAKRMNAPLQSTPRAGFTLIEVLVSLGLCAVLAVATASAITFAARTERAAARSGEAALILQSLYAAQRLRPDDLPVAPRGWRVEHSSEILTRTDESLREWVLISLAADGNEIPPFTLRILDDTP